MVPPTEVMGDRGIDQAKRIRIFIAVSNNCNLAVLSCGQQRRLALADAIERHDKSGLETAGVVSTGRMAQMMSVELDWPLILRPLSDMIFHAQGLSDAIKIIDQVI